MDKRPGYAVIVDLQTSNTLEDLRNRNYTQFHIIEIAWIVVDPWHKIITSQVFLVQPDTEIVNTEVHGITTAMAARHGIPFANMCSILQRDLQLYQPTVLMSYNIEFDRGILMAAVDRCNPEVYTYLDGMTPFCLMLHATSMLKETRYVSLKHACERMRLPKANIRRAAYGVKAAYAILKVLLP